MTDIRPFLVNGEWRTGEGTFEVKSPYDDSVVAELGVPTAADVEEAIATAAETFEESPSASRSHARAERARPHLAAPGRDDRGERRADRRARAASR